MSTSTIYIKSPTNYRQSLAKLKNTYNEYSPVLSTILWAFSGFCAASKSGFNPSVTGMSLSFSVLDLLLMSVGSVFLYRGLVVRNILLILPWIALNIYSLYFNHYLGLINTLTTLKTVKKVSWLPWGTLLISIILLIIRVTLIVRVFQLCVHLWIKKKLDELKSQLKK